MLLASGSYSYPLLGVFWTIFEIFLWVIWFWILITVFIDIFRSHDLSGGMKALWFLFVLFIPLIGVLVYLIARGGKCMSGLRSRLSSRTRPSALMSSRPQARGPRRTSWPSSLTCATGVSSRPRSSIARRPRSWPERSSAREPQSPERRRAQAGDTVSAWAFVVERVTESNRHYQLRNPAGTGQHPA